jgi:Zn finger protein HypA/HybF involved in hydrogenase expression
MAIPLDQLIEQRTNQYSDQKVTQDVLVICSRLLTEIDALKRDLEMLAEGMVAQDNKLHRIEERLPEYRERS